MWIYSQTTGKLNAPDGSTPGFGYSGRGADLNNPSGEADVAQGPIPEGMWTIGAFFNDPGGKGPIVCHLTPYPETDTFGRSGFMIHGDNSEANHTASEGCIILARPLREAIEASGDHSLQVTP